MCIIERGGNLFKLNLSGVYVSPLKSTKVVAFTLAEVLITLGIIGVVAAMTIPTLMTKIQNLVLEQQLKKATSVINQALELVYERTDTIYNCYYGAGSNAMVGVLSGECKKLHEEMLQTLKIAQICDSQAYKKGCIPLYKGIDDVVQNGGGDVDYALANCGGFSKSNMQNRNFAWVLNDGMIIGGYSVNFGNIFYIDVNGKKKPNEWGKDIYSFMLHSDGVKLYSKPGGCGMNAGNVWKK
ncbi:MAG: type II secretion system GspH family protein [Candidatus Gastranaerophilales bacterium]|nr:type II secretion system GspH family protein [Candidatus Gastranaerophilales bacterium]